MFDTRKRGHQLCFFIFKFWRSSRNIGFRTSWRENFERLYSRLLPPLFLNSALFHKLHLEYWKLDEVSFKNVKLFLTYFLRKFGAQRQMLYIVITKTPICMGKSFSSTIYLKIRFFYLLLLYFLWFIWLQISLKWLISLTNHK